MAGWRGRRISRGAASAAALLGLVGALATSGCARAPSETEAHERLAALEAEGRALGDVLHGVEVRLLGNQGALHLWEELGRRHQEVSALHCGPASAHLEAMAKHYERMEEKARGLRRRVADATVHTRGTQVRSGRN